MIRVLFSALAVVVVVLGIVLENPMLYAVAAVLILIVLMLLFVVARRRQGGGDAYLSRSDESGDRELESLGIVDIRPRSRSLSESEPRGERPVAEPFGGESFGGEASRPSVPPATSKTAPSPVRQRSEAHAKPDSESSIQVQPGTVINGVHASDHDRRPERRDKKPSVVEEDPASVRSEKVLEPVLQSLRSALGARTVCLLRQEDITPDYEVCAVAGPHAEDRHFATESPLLTPSIAQQAVTVRHVGENGVPVERLGYSADPKALRQVALAPVPRSTETNAGYVLVADTTRSDALSGAYQRNLLAQYARLLGTLLDAPERGWQESEQIQRSRREIIAEEMKQARAEDKLLALALVYLNRAEALADEGRAAVVSAERSLEATLSELTTNGRVVQFGELTYGVFYDGSVPEVETWGARVQRAFGEKDGELEGGVSIGIALLRQRHEDPDDFRADATDALREAYESGTCTILE